MPEKDPATYSWLVHAWVFFLSAFGGLAHFSGRVQDRQTTWRDVGGLATEVIIAMFVGVVTFYLCEWRELHPLLTAALVGLSAHMGTRAIFHLETVRNRIFGVPRE